MSGNAWVKKRAAHHTDNWLSGFGEPPLVLSMLQRDWLERGFTEAITEARAEERRSIEARLREPDEAMVDALFEATIEHYSTVDSPAFDGSPEADIKATLRALADVLSAPPATERE